MIIEEIKKALEVKVKGESEKISVVSRKDGAYKRYKVKNNGGILGDYIEVNFDTYEIILKDNGAIIGKYNDLKSLKYAVIKGVLNEKKVLSIDSRSFINFVSADGASRKVALSEKYKRYNAARKAAKEIGEVLESFTKKDRAYKTEEEIKKAVEKAKEFIKKYGE